MMKFAAARSLLLLIFVAAAGCAPRPGPEALSVAPQVNTARQVEITVATTRARDPATGVYTQARAPSLNYEAFTVSIPPGHEVTQIEWPKGRPDPKTSFAVTHREVLPDLALDRRSGKRDILIFVHGYNYTFEESLFRLAQLAADGEIRDRPVLFAWPSAASVTGYVADKDAVAYSRDDLVNLLTAVAADPDARNITLFGHSMGGLLVVEALRQLRLTGQHKVIDSLNDVVLAAPDIDIDVFRRQVRVIGPMQPPMILLVSPDDRALRLSGRLAGSRSRVGVTDASDPRIQALAVAAGIQVVDISRLHALDATRHNRFVALANVLRHVPDARTSTLAQAGSYILRPIGAALGPPL